MYDLTTQTMLPQPEAANQEALAPRPDDTAAGVRVLQRLLDAVPYAMLLVQDDGDVVFANRAARHDLDEQHPLQLQGRQIKVRRPQDVAPLRDALFNACRRGLQRMLTLGDALAETVNVAVAPAGGTAGYDIAAAMLVFGKRDVCENLSADAFARHHGLTPAETRVLRQLCAGRKPSLIAREQGVAISTVRTQVASIHEKTGLRNTPALVHQVAKLPPLVNLLRHAA